MRAILKRFREQTPTLIGAALLSLVMDGFILIYRLIGLPRAMAAYAGLLTFIAAGGLLIQRLLNRLNATMKEDDDHA